MVARAWAVVVEQVTAGEHFKLNDAADSSSYRHHNHRCHHMSNTLDGSPGSFFCTIHM